MGTGFGGGLNMKFSGPSFLTQGFQHQWFRAVRNLLGFVPYQPAYDFRQVVVHLIHIKACGGSTPVTAAFKAREQFADVHVAVGVEDAVADVDHHGILVLVFVADAHIDHGFGEHAVNQKAVPGRRRVQPTQVGDGDLLLNARIGF
jgi:hypothetical protein